MDFEHGIASCDACLYISTTTLARHPLSEYEEMRPAAGLWQAERRQG